MFQQKQDSLTTQMQQLKQTLQDQLDGRSIENDMPNVSATPFAGQLEHGKQKMKIRLEYDRSSPALFSAFESQLDAKLRIDGPVIRSEVSHYLPLLPRFLCIRAGVST